WIEDDTVAPAAVTDQIRDQRHGLHRWMEFKITAPRRIKAIDAGVIENIGTVPALTAELKVVDVRSGSAFEDRDELVFRAVKATLAGVALVPNQTIFPFRIEWECSAEEFSYVAPAHENIMDGSILAGADGAAHEAFEKGAKRRRGHFAGGHRKFPMVHLAATHGMPDPHIVGRVSDHHLGK